MVKKFIEKTQFQHYIMKAYPEELAINMVNFPMEKHFTRR